MPFGVLQFIPIYHCLHDGLQIHSEVCVLLFITLLSLIAWTSDRRPTAQARTATISGLSSYSLFTHYYLFTRDAQICIRASAG